VVDDHRGRGAEQRWTGESQELTGDDLAGDGLGDFTLGVLRCDRRDGASTGAVGQELRSAGDEQDPAEDRGHARSLVTSTDMPLSVDDTQREVALKVSAPSRHSKVSKQIKRAGCGVAVVIVDARA